MEEWIENVSLTGTLEVAQPVSGKMGEKAYTLF